MRRRLGPKEVWRPSARRRGAVLAVGVATPPLAALGYALGYALGSSPRSWGALVALTGWLWPLPVVVLVTIGIIRFRGRTAAGEHGEAERGPRDRTGRPGGMVRRPASRAQPGEASRIARRRLAPGRAWLRTGRPAAHAGQRRRRRPREQLISLLRTLSGRLFRMLPGRVVLEDASAFLRRRAGSPKP